MTRWMPWSMMALAVTACSKGTDEAAEPAAPRVQVTLEPIRLDTLSEDLVLTGRLTTIPGGGAVITAPAAGVVRGVRVQIGTPVGAGEALLDLDVPELSSSVRQLEAAAALADKDAARQRALLADGIAAQRRVDETEAAAVSARAAADAAVRLLARTHVRSPLRGTVLRLGARDGERVDAGALLAEVVQGGTLDLLLPVPAPMLPRISRNAAVAVRADGDTTAHAGRVLAVGPGVDSLTNAGQVVVRVPNAAGALRPGSGATGTVRLGRRAGVLSVPATALVIVGGTSSVFVVGADSVAHARAVTLGVRSGSQVEIRGDSLRAGLRVATIGAAGLQEGTHVVEAAAEKAAAEKSAP